MAGFAAMFAVNPLSSNNPKNRVIAIENGLHIGASW